MIVTNDDPRPAGVADNPFHQRVGEAIAAMPVDEKLRDQIHEVLTAAVSEIDPADPLRPVRPYWWRRVLQLLGNRVLEFKSNPNSPAPAWVGRVRDILEDGALAEDVATREREREG